MKILKRKTIPGEIPGRISTSGDRPREKSRISLIHYNQQEYEKAEQESFEGCIPYLQREGVTWINVEGLNDEKLHKSVSSYFNIHPMVIEDILNIDQRPKMEDYEKYMFIVLKYLSRSENSLISEQISFILTDSALITFQEKPGDPFTPVRDRISSGKGKIRSEGADYLTYCLTDLIIDSVFPVLEETDERLQLFENELTSGSSEIGFNDIHNIKRDLLLVRRSTWPMREVLKNLSGTDYELIGDKTRYFFSDCYDHSISLMDLTETYRELAAGLTDLFLNIINKSMNETMKVLTVIATIFIPVTFIAGIYGMNFRHMPELRLRWAYPAVLLVMAAIIIVMLKWFRRKNWL